MSTEERFAGKDGHRHLVEAWAKQGVAASNPEIAARLAAVSSVETIPPQTVIFDQGSSGTDFYLVLLGSVRIDTNGRPGPIRIAGSHFGEMALIDVGMRRSASVRAIEETVVARVTERDFAAVAQDHPLVWRALAIEISQRLRQRLVDVPMRNEKPLVFVGSSREGLPVANVIKAAIESDRVDVRIWTDGVFRATETTIESLEGVVREADFAVLVFTPDDALRTRGKRHYVPRDNVVFELGLFMGALGRSRTFVVRRRPGFRSTFFGLVDQLVDRIYSKAVKVPSDLLNVTALTYEDGAAQDLTSRLASACNEIRIAIARLEMK